MNVRKHDPHPNPKPMAELLKATVEAAVISMKTTSAF
eukprot:CAMPEP_0174267568 /NCGR_PEP_ID=MMETSP0439-20130205/34069_1 /TAXON_ID=0 /ORGANISM="Stereomyxa ramosa, Strain Chinc5" /LENGTH=36 /DNA_ID= /DNA_START= /DNA_END= /DNA_ORIENTATION=